MSKPERLTAIISVSNKGFEFCGIFSEQDDIDDIVLDRTTEGDVICASFARVSGEGIPEHRMIYAKSPDIKLYQQHTAEVLN